MDRDRRIRALERIAEDWMERVWRRGRAEVVLELHAPAFVDHSAAGRRTDREAFADGVRECFAAFPDFRAETDELLVDARSDAVTIRWTARGTHTGTFLGFEPTGRLIVFRGIEILRIRDDRITERWGEWDGLDLMDQLRGDD